MNAISLSMAVGISLLAPAGEKDTRLRLIVPPLFFCFSKQTPFSYKETARQIDYAIRDNLVNIIKRVGHKGSKTGVEQESHR